MAKLNKSQIGIMAAIFGISNLGMDQTFLGPSPDVTPEEVQNYYTEPRWPPGTEIDTEAAVARFGGSFFESEDMANSFYEEARTFEKELKRISVETLKKRYGDRYGAFIDAIV